MGHNSTDALAAFMREYLSRCRVVGDKIIPPDAHGHMVEYDPTAGGHKVPFDPKPANPDVRGPDWKRGQ